LGGLSFNPIEEERALIGLGRVIGDVELGEDGVESIEVMLLDGERGTISFPMVRRQGSRFKLPWNVFVGLDRQTFEWVKLTV